MKLVLASRNRKKLEEIRVLFHLPELEVVCAVDVPGAPEVEEDGDTFEANAIKKAVALARAAGAWSLADDSGLEVDALGGAPGVRSARYAGEPADDAANNRKLLEDLGGRADRSARFRCVIALASPSGAARTVSGACEGRIIAAPRGAGGFGYDPLFVPIGFEQTFAELDAAAKNRISHRGQALGRARAAWADLLRAGALDWPSKM